MPGISQRGTRRELFSFAARGLMGAAVLGIVNKVSRASDGVLSATHHPAKAKRVIHICLCGGLSHVDSFDYKPRLRELHGTELPASVLPCPCSRLLFRRITITWS